MEGIGESVIYTAGHSLKFYPLNLANNYRHHSEKMKQKMHHPASDGKTVDATIKHITGKLR